jgi:signal peptidase I
MIRRLHIPEHARKELIDFFKMVVWFALFFFCLRTFVVEGFEIQGSSMEPTLEENERLFVLKFVYRFDNVERGDVIVFLYPEDRSRRFIKRVIGLPGDTVEIRKGQVWVNGKELQEAYLNESYFRPERDVSKVTVPADCYYVLGDHRSVSSDSRSGWFVPRKNIVGKAALRFWPVTRFGTI